MPELYSSIFSIMREIEIKALSFLFCGQILKLRFYEIIIETSKVFFYSL